MGFVCGGISALFTQFRELTFNFSFAFAVCIIVYITVMIYTNMDIFVKKINSKTSSGS